MLKNHISHGKVREQESGSVSLSLSGVYITANQIL